MRSSFSVSRNASSSLDGGIPSSWVLAKHACEIESKTIEEDHGEETDDVEFEDEHLFSHDVSDAFRSDAADDLIAATKSLESATLDVNS